MHDFYFFCQKQFTWEAPYFRALYGESEFNWMENVSTLKNLVASTGFSFNFLENRPSDIELTEGKRMRLRKHLFVWKGNCSKAQYCSKVLLCECVYVVLSLCSVSIKTLLKFFVLLEHIFK